VRRTGCAGERAGGYRGGEGATGRGVRSQRCGSGSSFSSSRKRHERDGNVEAGLSVRTRSAGFGAATHLLRRWPLRLSRAATCARAVSDWPRARRRARLVAIFQRFELEGELRLIFFDRANRKQSQTSTVLAVRKTRFVPFWRVSFSPTFEAFFRALGQRTRRDGVDREHAAPPRGHRRVEGRGQRLLPRGRFPQGRGRVHQGAQGTSSRASRLAFSNHANRRSADARGASL
jgi:hypothetical protein